MEIELNFRIHMKFNSSGRSKRKKNRAQAVDHVFFIILEIAMILYDMIDLMLHSTLLRI